MARHERWFGFDAALHVTARSGALGYWLGYGTVFIEYQGLDSAAPEGRICQRCGRTGRSRECRGSGLSGAPRRKRAGREGGSSMTQNTTVRALVVVDSSGAGHECRPVDGPCLDSVSSGARGMRDAKRPRERDTTGRLRGCGRAAMCPRPDGRVHRTRVRGGAATRAGTPGPVGEGAGWTAVEPDGQRAGRGSGVGFGPRH